MSVVSTRRRKATTYGKSSQNKAHRLFSDDAPSPLIPHRPKTSKSRAGDEEAKAKEDRATAQSPPPRAATGKLVAPSPRKRSDSDIFDIPSSGDEGDPFKFTTSKPTRSLKPGRKPAQLNPGGPNKPSTKAKEPRKMPTENARKRKRDVDNKEPAPKSSKPASEEQNGVDNARQGYKRLATPVSPDGDKAPAPTQAEQSLAKRARKTRSKMDTPPRLVQQGVSAPAALTRMVPEEASANLADEQDPSNAAGEIGTAADFLPSTPPSAPRDSPSASPSGAVTPRQRDLWKKLLRTSETAHHSPGSLRIAELDLARGSKTKRTASLTRSASEVLQNQGLRLVDTLKTSSQLSEGSDSDEDDTSRDYSIETFVRRSSSILVPDNIQGSQSVSKSSKATYALESRTYLQEKDDGDVLDLLGEEINQSACLAPSHSRSQIEDDLDEEEDSQSKQPRSVHDLRAAGARRRLLDWLESLVDEVSGQGSKTLSAKRSALIELCTKLFQKDAINCLLDCSLDRKLLEHASAVSDGVFNFVAAVALSLIAEESTRPATLRKIHDSRCFTNVLQLLRVKQDISKVAKERKANMSRIAQSSVLEFRGLVAGSAFWPCEPDVVSPRLVALKALDVLVYRMREQGNKDVLLDDELIGTLLSILEEHAKAAEGGSAGDAIIPGLALSVLMASSLFDRFFAPEQLKRLAHVVPSFITQSRPGTDEFQPLTLKLCINVTNKNARACELFSSAAVIHPLLQSINECFGQLESPMEDEDRSTTLDRLILSLGALLNLAEFSSAARNSIVKTDNTALGEAVQHFVKGQERAQDAESLHAAESNIPYGWLAVVLANLCQDYQARERVRAEMPGQTLTALIAAVDTFSKIFQRTSLQEFEGHEGQAVAADFVERMRVVLVRLRELEG